jgi:hypothetical protein
MAENELPCLDLLAATPGILRGLMCEVSDEDARWKPAPDRFSIAEVLAHLSQSERDYRVRVDRFLSEQRPELEPDDAQLHLDLYRNADRRTSSTTSRSSAKPMWCFCARSTNPTGGEWRSTLRPAKSLWPKCCTNGRCTTSDTSARSRSWCARENTWKEPAPWVATTI